MTHKNIGIRPHHTLDGVRHYEPVRLKKETSQQLHLDKVLPEFQPFDLVRHHNHMAWLPTPHTPYRISQTPDNNGFWGKHGMDH